MQGKAKVPLWYIKLLSGLGYLNLLQMGRWVNRCFRAAKRQTLVNMISRYKQANSHVFSQFEISIPQSNGPIRPINQTVRVHPFDQSQQ